LPNQHPDFAQLKQFALEAVQEAGRQALTFFGKGRSSLKFDEDLVTEMELRLMESFQERLGASFQGHQAYLNNHDSQGYTHEGGRYLWIFDPLDGVANFQAGIPIWSTSVALVENFWPVLGAIFLPSTGDIYYAHAGQEAYWGDSVMRTSFQESISDESLLLTYSRFHQQYSTTFPGKIRNFGCTNAHIAFVAMGRAEAAIVANESYQDLAAARVLVEAAGGKISRLDGSEFFLNEYMDGEKIEAPLLVGSPEICAQVSACLKPAE
jgi:myo-inositol-1(or 4)-monophosphatase